MSLFPTITERRYTQCPRRYLNEYYLDSRRKLPDAKGSCTTLVSARTRATRACDQQYCSTVRIFDRLTGKYLLTYKQSVNGVLRHEGFVK